MREVGPTGLLEVEIAGSREMGTTGWREVRTTD